MKVGDVICIADFYDLCLQHVRDFVGNFSRILSQSWRNGIWALADWQGGELLETLQSDTGLTGNYYRYYHYNNN